MELYLNKIGGVAKGGLARAGELFAGGCEHADAVVEELLERISHGVLANDRRSAVNALRTEVTESRKAEVVLGHVGLPILFTVLREEREDLEMVRGAVEALFNAVIAVPTHIVECNNPCHVISELFMCEKEKVALLLSLLDEEDFYVRYHAMQLMTALIGKAPSGCFQNAILANPTGVSRLMDMMAEREVIRNEALLLLSKLTKSNEDLQKIVVFEGGFDKLFAIIKDEGGSEGGIVVQDSLELMCNLLHDNLSNQVFFRESSFLQVMPSFLQLRASSVDAALSVQKTANLLHVLECLKLVCATTLPTKERMCNQTVLMQKGILDSLLPLALHSSCPKVRANALWFLGDLVAYHLENQNLLGNATMEFNDCQVLTLSVIMNLVLVASSSAHGMAAVHVLDCFCHQNLDGQLLLASTLMPISAHNETVQASWQTFGSQLVSVFQGHAKKETMGSACRAALVLQLVLANNVRSKERMLQIELEDTVTSRDAFLLHKCGHFLQLAASMKDTGNMLQAAMLRLLLTWLCDCPAAVSNFLGRVTHLPLIVELVNGRGSNDVHVMGFASLLLGVCIVHNQTVGVLDSVSVMDVVLERVGLSDFFSNVENLMSSQYMQAALANSRPRIIQGDHTEALWTFSSESMAPEIQAASEYDFTFAQWASGFGKQLQQHMVIVYSRPKQVLFTSTKGVWEVGEDTDTPASRLERARALITAQDMEMAEIRARSASLAGQLLELTKGHAFADSEKPENLGSELASKEACMEATVAVLENQSKSKLINFQQVTFLYDIVL